MKNFVIVGLLFSSVVSTSNVIASTSGPEYSPYRIVVDYRDSTDVAVDINKYYYSVGVAVDVFFHNNSSRDIQLTGFAMLKDGIDSPSIMFNQAEKNPWVIPSGKTMKINLIVVPRGLIPSPFKGFIDLELWGRYTDEQRGFVLATKKLCGFENFNSASLTCESPSRKLN